jgi:ectoine hydroxylase-related dioxygenase (phytanoyl-CoA dioxygenase family)
MEEQSMALRRLPKLTDKKQRQFESDGYIFPIGVFERAEAERYLANFVNYQAQNQCRLESLSPRDKYQVFAETHYVLHWVYEIVSHPKVLDAIEGLLGHNLLVWATDWFVKMPGEKTYVSMHQDGTYWNLRPANVVTAWVALSPSTPSNGCMRVVPGTHKQPALPQRETYAPENALSRGQEIVVEIDEKQAVDMVLQPGEMSLHHLWIVHGSYANTSSTPRIGIAIRYVTPDVVQDSPGRPLAMLVRGRDDYGNFELLPPPPSQGDISMKAHTEIINRIHSSVMISAKK